MSEAVEYLMSALLIGADATAGGHLGSRTPHLRALP